MAYSPEDHKTDGSTEARVLVLEGLVNTMMETIEELATKLMLSQSTLILESDIQNLQNDVATLQESLTTLENRVSTEHP